ncbi:MAG: substrate-binding domain-containing protein [Alphaproteobacteria bacterium]|nr:substrate-binding domain-containing protein [Alphaproteobacteria bacterium]
MIRFIIIIAVLCGISPAYGQERLARDDVPYIIFVNHGRDYNNSWIVFRNGLVAGMNRFGLNIELRNAPKGELSDVNDLVESAIAAKPDGLILSVPRDEMAREWAQQAQANNIPVIFVGTSGISNVGGSNVGGSNLQNQQRFPLISIGQDHYQSGFLLGKRLKKLGKSNAICFVPRTDIDEYVTRCKGAADGLNQNLDIFSRDKIRNNLSQFLKDYLAQNPELQTIIITEITALNDIRKKLNAITGNENISLVSFGLTRRAAQFIRAKGQVLFTIDEQPFLQGYTAAMIYHNYFQHGIIWGNRHIPTGPQIINASKVGSIVNFAGTIR